MERGGQRSGLELGLHTNAPECYANVTFHPFHTQIGLHLAYRILVVHFRSRDGRDQMGPGTCLLVGLTRTHLSCVAGVCGETEQLLAGT
jgi:hypothetical protein